MGGAIIGGISGGIGSAAASALTPLITSAGGFIGGVVAGFVGGAVGCFFSGGFMSKLPGGNGDFWGGALKGTIMGAGAGGLIGGTIGGFKSFFQGKSFWTGKDIAPKVLNPKPTVNEISTLKAKSVESVGNTKTKGLNLKTPSKSNINSLKQQYEPNTKLDGGNIGVTRKPFTPDDVIRSVKGDNFSIKGSVRSGGNTTNAEILMNRRDFANLVNDFKANYKGVKFDKGGRYGYKFKFGSAFGNSTGSITNYDFGAYRFYWNSQGTHYKFIINVFENIR
ncbi:MAG: hypothetical protein ACWIPJ_10865 [Polaribacter sp.]